MLFIIAFSALTALSVILAVKFAFELVSDANIASVLLYINSWVFEIFFGEFINPDYTLEYNRCGISIFYTKNDDSHYLGCFYFGFWFEIVPSYLGLAFIRNKVEEIDQGIINDLDYEWLEEHSQFGPIMTWLVSVLRYYQDVRQPV